MNNILCQAHQRRKELPKTQIISNLQEERDKNKEQQIVNDI